MCNNGNILLTVYIFFIFFLGKQSKLFTKCCCVCKYDLLIKIEEQTKAVNALQKNVNGLDIRETPYKSDEWPLYFF